MNVSSELGERPLSKEFTSEIISLLREKEIKIIRIDTVGSVPIGSRQGNTSATPVSGPRWVADALLFWPKRPGSELNQSSPTSAEVKNT
jgi:hypothetical protein